MPPNESTPLGQPRPKRHAGPGVVTKWCHHFFSKNGCERGFYCTFAHTYEDFKKEYIDRDVFSRSCKMVLCKYWSKNWRCKEGAECRFAHGNAEMGRSLGVVDDRGFFRDEDIRAPRPLVHQLKTEGSSIPVGYSKWKSHQNEDGKWEWSVCNGAGSSGDTVRHVLPPPPAPPMLPPELATTPPGSPRQPMTPPELLAPRTPVKTEPSDSPRSSKHSDYDYSAAHEVKTEPCSPSNSGRDAKKESSEEPLPRTPWGRWYTPEEEAAELDSELNPWAGLD